MDRIGPMHQAGSDSLLTAQTFFSLLTKHFDGDCDDSKFKGELFGLGTNHTKYKNGKFTGSSNEAKMGSSASASASASSSVRERDSSSHRDNRESLSHRDSREAASSNGGRDMQMQYR